MKNCPNCGRSLVGLRADHVDICNIRDGTLPQPRITSLDQIRSRPPADPLEREGVEKISA